ncbi:MAG: transketolase [Oscillospiraceae bacterium]|nr:transketolase [Oscillospiraceae bacterium]
MDKQELEVLAQKARELRRMTVEMIGGLGVGHIGGSVSMIDALVVLYYKVMNIDPKDPQMEGRDRFVLSKGHSGPGLYSVLADKGYFEKSHLATLNRPGSILPSHPDMNRIPGIDMSTGSLGQGFSCAVGFALGSKLKKDGATIYAMVGDGESQEGQIWEAAMFAGHHKLDNIIALTDYNGMQVDGYLSDIVDVAPLADKWRAFNWNVIEVTEGNDIEQIYNAVMTAKGYKGKPSMIILHTIKGKDVSFAEAAKEKCHSMTITPEMMRQALEALV